MVKVLKDFIKTKPRLFDLLYSFRPIKSDLGKWLDNFSKESGRKVNFVQIGVNDGLRGDPIRRFIIRDRWSGIFVEPLPIVFNMLKHNYSYVKKQKLIFVNAAISSKDYHYINIWSYSENFCNSLSLERKLYYLRKSSFDKKHVEANLADFDNCEDKIKCFRVKCMSMNSLIQKYWDSSNIDLILIDAEGHDDVIIRSIDFHIIHPKAIIFESGHLPKSKKHNVCSYLSEFGYKIYDMRGDSVAVLDSI